MSQTKLHAILETGVNAGASDWHIREGSTVVLRVDAQLAEISEFVPTRDFLDSALKGICTEKMLEEFEETGDCDFAHVEEGVGRFRVNLHKERGRTCLCLRHIKDKVPDLSKLGLPDVILKLSEAQRGIILITGTTGSGKSTTMACMLEHMNETQARHIITIEDPIEYSFKDKNCIFEQREIGLDAITFDSALIHALRQDPDVIVVGEMRRRESFDTALHAADTGHLVISTLHTTNASLSIQRLLDFYPHEERKQVQSSIASNLFAIASQRLIPRAIGRGVVPAMEVMINSPIIRKLLTEGQINKLPAAIAASRSEGMMTYDQCLLELVNDGLITEECALERATNQDALKMNLKGIFLGDDGGIVG